jgi:hypothetical protein
MPNTYTRIASNVLSSSTSSVTFSAIPSTYTDLVLKATISTNVGFGDASLRLNSVTSTFYSITNVRGDGATVATSNTSNTNSTSLFYAVCDKFSNIELYFPNYTSSANKPFFYFCAAEAKNTEAWVNAQANLARISSAITSIQIFTVDSFISGSSFYLYGIKNS